MNGSNVTVKSEETWSDGGVSIVTSSRTGTERIVSQFKISGNCSFRILTVFFEAVAVIRSIFPPMLHNSPEEKSMEGRNARFFLSWRPQLTTKGMLNARCVRLNCLYESYLNEPHQSP